jgi:hypothetical protein
MKNPALFLFPVLMLTGCTTVKYEPKTAAGPAKPADYPIYVYTEKMKVPRPFEIIGTMRVGDTPITMIGGSLEAVLKTLRQNARQKGADALRLTAVNEPGFTSANYRVDANFLRFTDAWESVSLSEDELRAYFRTNGQTLDPIEGIWFVNDAPQSRVAIMKNSSKPGRDFVAFILNTKNPSWRRGDKKMDIASGERQGVYRGDYYLDDYQGKRVAFTLRGTPASSFVLQMSEESYPIVFSREQTAKDNLP